MPIHEFLMSQPPRLLSVIVVFGTIGAYISDIVVHTDANMYITFTVGLCGIGHYIFGFVKWLRKRRKAEKVKVNTDRFSKN